MARIIGGEPHRNEIFLNIMYHFVKEELPDYICASFLPNVNLVESNDVKKSCHPDMLIFIPHMGVFLFDVNGFVSWQMESGSFYWVYPNGKKVQISLEKRYKKMQEEEAVVRHYVKERFNITPLVYELECMPLMKIPLEDKYNLPPDFNPQHIVLADDIQNGLTFLHKLMSYCIIEQEKKGKDFYEDLTDKDVHDLFYFWDTGLWGAKRPDRPPFVFLSYNQNNNEISKEIQTVLEDRGVYVWRAPKDVPLGKYYLPEEMQAIEECDAFLILLSSPAQRSEEVKKEFDKALEVGKPILPLWVEDVPENEISKYYKERLTECQYRTMTKINLEVVEEIVQAVKAIKAENDKK